MTVKEGNMMNEGRNMKEGKMMKEGTVNEGLDTYLVL